MKTSSPNNSPDQEDVWQDILDGKRSPVQIIYVTKNLKNGHLDSIKQWGEYIGLYRIHEVKTLGDAIELNKILSADIFALNDCSAKEAQIIASESPQTPIYMAQPAGYPSFDFSKYPPQVTAAGWVAPREHEFMEAIADGLSKVATEIIWRANHKSLPSIEFIKSVSDELLSRLAYFPEERFKLNPRLFEETVAELLSKMGYEIQLTPHSGDKGRDIIAYYNTPIASMLMLVECKRYAAHRLVGPEPITRLWSRMFDDHANMAMVITTSGFQSVAQKTAKDRGYQISLKDGQDFIRWIDSLRAK